MSARRKSNVMAVAFSYERDTKNMVRFQEVVADGASPMVGTLYLSKEALAAAGCENPSGLSVAITVASEGPAAAVEAPAEVVAA